MGKQGSTGQTPHPVCAIVLIANIVLLGLDRVQMYDLGPLFPGEGGMLLALSQFGVTIRL